MGHRRDDIAWDWAGERRTDLLVPQSAPQELQARPREARREATSNVGTREAKRSTTEAHLSPRRKRCGISVCGGSPSRRGRRSDGGRCTRSHFSLLSIRLTSCAPSQFTIKNSSSSLERRINRWAADTLALQASRFPPRLPGTELHSYIPFVPLLNALYADLPRSAQESPFLSFLERNDWKFDGVGLVAQSLARNAISQVLAEGIINRLLVTDSEEANLELTKLHEELFNRASPTLAVYIEDEC